MKRRRITGYLDERGVWRDLVEPLGEPTGAQLRRLNRLGMLALVGPSGAVPLRKGEAAAAIHDARGAAELLDRTRSR